MKLLRWNIIIDVIVRFGAIEALDLPAVVIELGTGHFREHVIGHVPAPRAASGAGAAAAAGGHGGRFGGGLAEGARPGRHAAGERHRHAAARAGGRRPHALRHRGQHRRLALRRH